MNTGNIGKLERVALREVWQKEASDFTQWLQENIDILNEALDLTLINVEREQAAGAFSVDLVAEDEDSGTVIIENQLEKSNHDHLGKVITYLAGMNAKAAVWIVSDPRPEHVAAIAWLNEATAATFYMVKVEAVRIGDSPAAPLFTLIVGPSEAVADLGQTKKEIAERYSIRRRWWTQLIARSKSVSQLHAHLTPGEYSWIGVSSGVRGLNFNYVVTQNDCAVELYLDRGKEAGKENELLFDQLQEHQTEVENKFGDALKWQRLESKRACRIRYSQMDGGYRSPEGEWPQIQDRIINAMQRLEAALRPFLNQLNIKNL